MKILQTASCDAVFLGDRAYLHSTTIIPSLVLACENHFALGRVRQLTAQFHALTDRQCVFELLETPSGVSLTQAGYVATFKVVTFNVGGDLAEVTVGLRPTNATIEQRNPFDEDGLIEGFKLDPQAQTITLPSVHGAVLPTIVSLNKRLHSALFESKGYDKWLLTRLDLGPAYFNEPAPRTLGLHLLAILASVNSKAAILGETGNAIGSVQFSRKKETT